LVNRVFDQFFDRRVVKLHMLSITFTSTLGAGGRFSSQPVYDIINPAP
jgi:hypothetical protein